MNEAEIVCRRLFGEMMANATVWTDAERREKIGQYCSAYARIPWWRRLWLRWNWFISGSDVASMLCPDSAP